MRIVVVLPAALRPRKANVLPRATLSVTPRSTSRRAKRFVNRLHINRRFVHGFDSSIVAAASVCATPLVASARSSCSSSVRKA